MEQFFIIFYLHKDGSKEFTVKKVENSNDKMPEFSHKITEYKISEPCNGDPSISQMMDYKSFNNYTSIKDQLERWSQYGKYFVIEIPDSIFKMVEILFDNIFICFRNFYKEKKLRTSNNQSSQTLFGDYINVQTRFDRQEIKYYEITDSGMNTLISLVDGDDYKCIDRHFSYNMYPGRTTISKDYEVLEKGTIDKLNDIFNEKKDLIINIIEYIFGKEYERAIDDIMDDFWEEEERKYRRQIEEERYREDNYDSYDDY